MEIATIKEYKSPPESTVIYIQKITLKEYKKFLRLLSNLGCVRDKNIEKRLWAYGGKIKNRDWIDRVYNNLQFTYIPVSKQLSLSIADKGLTADEFVSLLLSN